MDELPIRDRAVASLPNAAPARVRWDAGQLPLPQAERTTIRVPARTKTGGRAGGALVTCGTDLSCTYWEHLDGEAHHREPQVPR